jgi:hypothetical protein
MQRTATPVNAERRSLDFADAESAHRLGILQITIRETNNWRPAREKHHLARLKQDQLETIFKDQQ